MERITGGTSYNQNPGEKRDTTTSLSGANVRKLCAPEIDELAACTLNRTLTLYKCFNLAVIMRRCLRHVTSQEYYENYVVPLESTEDKKKN